MGEAHHIAFASHFGEFEPHPTTADRPQHPEIFVIDTADGAPTAEWWHTDMTALAEPPMGSILHMQIIPDEGGDTEWANQIAAFEALSPKMQSFLSTLRAEHVAWWDAGVRNLHPIVRRHPESGRRGLFVNSIFTKGIEGLTEGESASLLSFLYEHATQEKFRYRHRWRKGDVAFWDNRCTQHRVHNDFGDARRPGQPYGWQLMVAGLTAAVRGGAQALRAVSSGR